MHRKHPQAASARETQASRSTPRTDPHDLGFGQVVARESRKRLLNRDGSFNIVRKGLGVLQSQSAYHTLLTITWPRFLALVAGFYVAVNLAFGFVYWALGPNTLSGPGLVVVGGQFWRAFFFSVQTFATIGYGQVSPVGFTANAVVATEALVGLLSLALVTGLLFARFARPTAAILFSRNAVVAPYGERTAFEFRIVNRRTNQLIELHARVLMSRIKVEDGRARRDFTELTLERTSVVFFPLSWTIVHPIDEHSPLHGLSAGDLAACDVEFLVLLTAVDETFAQQVHARTSYKADEVVWNARFADAFLRSADGQELIGLDVGKLHDIEPAQPVS